MFRGYGAGWVPYGIYRTVHTVSRLFCYSGLQRAFPRYPRNIRPVYSTVRMYVGMPTLLYLLYVRIIFICSVETVDVSTPTLEYYISIIFAYSYSGIFSYGIIST